MNARNTLCQDQAQAQKARCQGGGLAARTLTFIAFVDSAVFVPPKVTFTRWFGCSSMTR